MIDSQISGDHHDVLKGLLNPNPRERLGYVNQIDLTTLPCFFDVDFDSILKMKIPAPNLKVIFFFQVISCLCSFS